METTRAFQLEYSGHISFYFSCPSSLLHSILLAFPHLIPSLHATLLLALQALDRYSATHLQKLSDLCISYLRRGGSFPFNLLPPTPFCRPSLRHLLCLDFPQLLTSQLPASPNFNPALPTLIPTPPIQSLTSPPTLSPLVLSKDLSFPRPPTSCPTTQFLTSLTHFILTHNYFSFNSLHYLLVKGPAIGTRMAPSYANLFMGSLEEDFMNSEDSKPDLWLRFIDDIFLL